MKGHEIITRRTTLIQPSFWLTPFRKGIKQIPCDRQSHGIQQDPEGPVDITEGSCQNYITRAKCHREYENLRDSKKHQLEESHVAHTTAVGPKQGYLVTT